MPADQRPRHTTNTPAPRPRRGPILVFLTAGACWTTSAVLIAACAGGGTRAAQTSSADTPTFKAPAKPADLAAQSSRADAAALGDDAGNLAEVFSQLRAPAAGSPESGRAPTARRTAAADRSPAAQPEAEPLPLAPAERRAAAARELRGLLDADPPLGGELTDTQRRSLETVRAVLSALERGEEPTELSNQLPLSPAPTATQISPIDPTPASEQPSAVDAPLSLGTVALAQRVESFGRFVEFNSDRFVAAGRSIPMLVYTEVADFTQPGPDDAPGREEAASSDSAGGGWTVELGQELRLYAADGSEQWREPERVIRNSARSRRNDYYLVQRIELPARLSVGKYALKVIVRDKLSGEQAERNIPFQIVADASAVGASQAQRPTTNPARAPGQATGQPSGQAIQPALITRSTEEPPRNRE